MGPRFGLDWCGKSRPIGIRSPDRPARRQSLYRLRCPAHAIAQQNAINPKHFFRRLKKCEFLRRILLHGFNGVLVMDCWDVQRGEELSIGAECVCRAAL